MQSVSLIVEKSASTVWHYINKRSLNYAELVEFNYFELIYYKVGAVFSINWGKYDKVGRYYQVWQALLQRRSVLRYYKTGARAITKWGR